MSAPAQPKTLRLGMAGLGVASTMVLPGVEKFPHAKIAAAADLRESARKAFEQKYGGRTYASIEELCADPDIDVVWVVTPNQLHRQHVIMAAEAGKHVVCTKPMALTVQECEDMCLACERNGVKLLCGQTYSMSPDVHAMWEVARSGELGRLIGINVWFYTDWLIKPRVAEETTEALGGGVVYRHAPHLIDTVRLLGGGKLRSVRAMVGRWMPERPCPGNFSAYMEFEDGTPATIVYNGYGYFDTSELTWGIGNRMYSEDERVRVRRQLRHGEIDDEVAKEGMRFGAAASDASSTGSGWTAGEQVQGSRAHMHWFGVIVASFERGDVRQSPNGLFVYSDDGKREIPVTGDRGTGMLEMEELYGAIYEGKPIIHDGRWGMATLEVGTAMVESARERREIMLTHQCAVNA
ncbi:MAG TPA: Gfo/Idh/MocA family oxidoreductase [Chloroflexota bacterium]|nr:Gfo/Idh/MocA family oxidoreductase [Chloroflexota bacterium]